MAELNIVVGLSGVGKGTVIEEAQKLSHTDFKVVNYGDRMLEQAKNQGLVSHRDEMKDIETGKYRDIQKNAAKSISDEEGNILVDTHATIKTPYGYVPGLPRWTLNELNPSKIIMVEATASEIISRTESDEGRDRDTEHADIQEYKDMARRMAASGAVQTGAYLEIIHNNDGKASEAAERLVELIEN